MFVNSSATDIVLVTLSSTAVERAIAQCTSRWAMARGHRLNTSIVLAAVHGLSGLFRAVSAVESFTLSPPSHSVPVPNRPTRLCGRKATLNQTKRGHQSTRHHCLAIPHTPGTAFWHLPPNSARFSHATEEALDLYLRAAVQRGGQRPPNGSGTDMTVEAT